jgi:hypothetical protein
MAPRNHILRTGLAVLFIVLVWVIFCRPWLFSKLTVPFDSKDEFYPTLYFISQSLRGGDLPLWNPYTYGGSPIVSDPQSLMFSPLALGMMTAVNKPSVHWFDAMELVHLLLGGLGMLWLSRRFGLQPASGILSAVVYMVGGSAAARLQHVPMIVAYSYFPFALAALDAAIKSVSIRWAVVAGLLTGILASHQNQVAYLFSLVLAGYVVYCAVSSGELRAFLAKRAAALTATLVACLATVAVPLYFTLQFLPLSNRPSIPLDRAIGDSLHPLALLTFVIRNFFDSAHPNGYWGPGDITQTYIYAGILPMILILRYGVLAGRLLDWHFRFFLGVGILSLLYALGGATPFYSFLYYVLPGVGLYRRPTDATFVLNMVVAVASGFLFDRILQGQRDPIRRWILIPTAALLLLVGIIGYRHAVEAGKAATLTREAGLTLLFSVIVLWLLKQLAAVETSTVRVTLTVLVLALFVKDVQAYNTGMRINAHPVPPDSLMANATTGSHPVARFLEQGPRTDRRRFRVEIASAGLYWSNASMMLGVESTQGYNPLRYLLYERVAGVQEAFNTPRPFTRLFPNYEGPMLNLLGVQYIVSGTTGQIADAIDGRFPLAFEEKDLRVWSNPRVAPRVLTATSLYIDPQLNRTIDEGSMPPLDYSNTVVLDHVPVESKAFATAAGTVVPLPGQGDVRADIRDYGNDEVTIDLRTERDAIVVLNDVYYPYWRVYVDGQERELLQANYLFRGVYVRPGDHAVVFRFEPLSWPALSRTVTGLYKRSNISSKISPGRPQ